MEYALSFYSFLRYNTFYSRGKLTTVEVRETIALLHTRQDGKTKKIASGNATQNSVDQDFKAEGQRRAIESMIKSFGLEHLEEQIWELFKKHSKRAKRIMEERDGIENNQTESA